MRHLAAIIVLLLTLAVGPVRAAHTEAKLLLSAAATVPGDVVLAGVQLKMEPGWHTYWKNPGDSGQATEIKWQLPPGVTAGEVQWPLPEKLPPADVTTYGYEDEVVLIVPLKLAANLPAGALNLVAKVSWLECKESCVPGSATVQATLLVGTETKASANAALFESWKAKLPQDINHFSLQAWWETAKGDKRPLNLGSPASGTDKNFKYDAVEFFPNTNDDYEVSANTEVLSAFSAELHLHKNVKKLSGDWPKEISGVLVVEQNKTRSGYEIKLPISDKAPAGGSVSAQPQPVQAGGTPAPLPQSLGRMLLFAFIGGLILNIMPCVLPVIALKILGFVSEAKSEPRRVRKLGLIYALGVLLSFLALAAGVIGVKAAGHHAGWGMQFGSPIFVVCLTTLVMLVALNLFGLFEVTLGGRALDTAGELAAKHGAAGAFFNGVLATILATPCTAPFLGAALGFAFAQNASVIVLIFLTVGLGLASPYILLSWNPAWLKFLPKPGAWMEKFKIAMGFPMLATVMWLFNVAASSYGRNVLWLGIFLVVVAFAAWIFGEFFQRGRQRKGVALAFVLILLASGYAFTLEKGLDWRAPIIETNAAGALKASGAGIDWQPWSPEAVAAARAAGRPVLVDFTASWCVTCNAIVKPALENNSVLAKLKVLNAVALLADYTRTPPAITEEIAKYGVAGVPLVLVYPKNPDLPPLVLPQPSPLQLPSGYSRTVLDALNRASQP